MKIVYIAGLEHSGTTLLSHLLSRWSGTHPLGEVGTFFQPSLMESYATRWERYPDVFECSCGEQWDVCRFWSPLQPLGGLHSALPLNEKYRELIAHSRRYFSDHATIVDSSKSLAALQALSKESDSRDLFVLLSVKDVRSFATSILRKQGVKRSLHRCVQTFNWWEYTNRTVLDFLDSRPGACRIVHYEMLCFQTDLTLSALRRWVDPSEDLTMTERANTHIVLGNKDFLNHKRERVVYDHRWFLDDLVSLVYLFHPRARRLNRRLYELASIHGKDDIAR